MALQVQEVVKSALLSSDGRFRYQLTRSWSDVAKMVFVMLNPSTADAETDDATIRRCMRFASREQCGGIVVVNLFAFRTVDPKRLAAEGYPNGPDNISYVAAALNQAQNARTPAVMAWGAFDKPWHSEAWRWIMDRDDYDFRCLGTAKDGSPRHPLYVKGEQPLELWPNAQPERYPPNVKGK